jgi:hypothetical protein
VAASYEESGVFQVELVVSDTTQRFAACTVRPPSEVLGAQDGSADEAQEPSGATDPEDSFNSSDAAREDLEASETPPPQPLPLEDHIDELDADVSEPFCHAAPHASLRPETSSDHSPHSEVSDESITNPAGPKRLRQRPPHIALADLSLSLTLKAPAAIAAALGTGPGILAVSAPAALTDDAVELLTLHFPSSIHPRGIITLPTSPGAAKPIRIDSLVRRLSHAFPTMGQLASRAASAAADGIVSSIMPCCFDDFAEQ